MGHGGWLGQGQKPGHPSAWCKAQQGWVTVINQTVAQQPATVEEVKLSKTVHRLWHEGKTGKEYFLVEHRQRT